MTNSKKTVTGSVSIADYSAMVYRYYFLTSCLPMYYDKICISKYIWNKFKFEISRWNFEICTKIEISYTILSVIDPLENSLVTACTPRIN